MNTAFIIAADVCNLKCIHCVWEKTIIPEPNEVNYSNINSILPILKKHGYNDINLTGGEPLLMPFSLDILRSAKSLDLSTSLCTNGILIDEEKALALKEARIDYLAISLNSLDPRENNNMRGGFKQVIKAIETAKKVGINEIHLSVTIGRKNIEQVNKIGNYALENNIGVSFSPLHVPLGADDYEIWSIGSLTLDERIETYNKIKSICQETKNHRFLKLFYAMYCNKHPKKPSQCFGCNTKEKNLVIDHNGDVYPCFFRKDLNAGNLFNHNPESVLENLEVVRKEVAGAKCFGDHCVGLHVG